MNGQAKKILPPVLVVVLILVAVVMLSGAKHDDKAEIENALASAVKASKEGRAGGVVAFLASNVVINGQSYNINQQFDSFVRKYHPDITLGAMEPEIQGDSAKVTTDIQFTVMTQSVDIKEVTFTLEKQSGHKWLFFPDQEWKITGATAPEAGYSQVLSELQMLGGTSIF